MNLNTVQFSTGQLVDRWEDQRDIKNLMGKYANCLILNRDAEIFSLFWSKNQPDICLGFNDGWYAGAEAIGGYYQAIHDRNVLIAELLQKRLPEKLGGKTADEIFGIGLFRVYPISCPIIEIAEDGKTAKGLWYCQGARADVKSCGPTSSWTWGYYAADFVREGDEWKIWHLQCVNDVDSTCGQSWGRPLTELPDLPEFAALKDYEMPAMTVTEILREPYHPKRPLTPSPRIPEQYSTFAETFSYGI